MIAADVGATFDSLPEGKRYATSADEWREVIARSNRAATALLGVDSPCWLVVPEYELDASHRIAELPAVALTSEVTIDVGDLDEKPVVTFWVANVVWRPGKFDGLLRAIADDQRRAVWVARELPAVFAPYDGGVDLIAPSRERRDTLKQEMRDWLSSRPDGF